MSIVNHEGGQKYNANAMTEKHKAWVFVRQDSIGTHSSEVLQAKFYII